MTRLSLAGAWRALAGACCVLFFGMASVALAEQTVLTLTRGGESLELSLEDLAALPQATVVTTHEFTDVPVEYKGPLARDVLQLFGLHAVDTVRFLAVNDYFIDVPTSDLHHYGVILALEADGRRLSRRDKGPLWLMYPISEFPELSSPIYNARLIWQVVRVEAL